ncbi:MAG: hypothetical protein V8R16_08375 [Bacilli bacterium]
MKKQVKTNMKSIIAVALASAILIGGTASIGYFSKGFKDWNIKNWFTTNDHVTSDNLATQLKIENGIKLQVKKLANDNEQTTLGTQIIKYTVDPDFYTEKVLYKIAYSDSSNVEEGILKIVHNDASCEVIVTCLKVFTKQIVLTLYAENHANVNASINIDFVEKLTPTFTLQAETGKPLGVNANVASTGGTISADKTVKNQKLVFNADFITKATNYILEDALYINTYGYVKDNDGGSSNPDLVFDTYEEAKKAGAKGMKTYSKATQLKNADVETWKQYASINSYLPFTNFDYTTISNYSVDTFVKSLSASIKINLYDYEMYDDSGNGVWNDSDANRYFLYTMSLYRINADHFKELFNGETIVFDYSCSINNKQYTSTFGLLLDEVNINGITADTTSIRF